MDKYFLIGSCRYQPIFSKHFPPRLHSTREILYFLDNFDNIPAVMAHRNSNYIFGDSMHKNVKDKVMKFAETRAEIMADINTVVLEISTVKVDYKGGAPVSTFYTQRDNVKTDKSHALTAAELESDLVEIKRKIAERWGALRIIVIPHVNLKIGSIPQRAELVKNLKNICAKLDVEFLSIGEKIESSIRGAKLDALIPDGSHFSKAHFDAIAKIVTSAIASCS